MKTLINQTTTCYHCGEDCEDTSIKNNEDKVFCCEGCKLVYDLLNENGLCTYYQLDKQPGINQRKKAQEGKFAFLDDLNIINKLIDFTDGEITKVNFYLPQMHCNSCIWLLENLQKINPEILHSIVNFTEREVAVTYRSKKISLRQVVETLSLIGYEPHISLNDIDENKIKKYDRARIYKLGIAGFCFGNIMLLSFPEYFSSGNIGDESIKNLFNYLIFSLSLPVFFYCSSEFYISAWKSLKQKYLNIDAPIALAIVITFARSVYEIVSETGSGYLDSMSGIVFFMLIGRYFQNKTYQSLNFDRDYKSYFPLSVTRKDIHENQKTISLDKLNVDDFIIIRNQELIPADSILISGKATIDYSFVTGEATPIEKKPGDLIYAGGRQIGSTIELKTIKNVSQSYLTQLWNNELFNDQKEEAHSFIHKLSRHFTWILFSIAFLTATYWYTRDKSMILTAVTSILIVACPCALLLSATFTNGNMMRIFAKNKLYLKSADVIEKLSKINHIVFDKTGTITDNSLTEMNWQGSNLSSEEKGLIQSLVKHSTHPMSRAIHKFLGENTVYKTKHFEEIPNMGLSANIQGKIVSVGSFSFINTESNKEHEDQSGIYVKINNEYLGRFKSKNSYRKGIKETIESLKKNYDLTLLSGDNENEKSYMQLMFGNTSSLLFKQTPKEKLAFIDQLENSDQNTLMLGDGLNDAGALKRSSVGIAITDDINSFSPSCDGILSGENLHLLHSFIKAAKASKKIIITSFIISICYNLIGLFFAVQGTLSPLIAAVLMPLSSISIVLFTTLVGNLIARTYQLKNI